MLEYNQIQFACYFDGKLVEYETWTDRGWMYSTPEEPDTLYFGKQFAHSQKELIKPKMTMA